MDMHCIHCSERVDLTMKVCRACGGDPWNKHDEVVIDLTERDTEQENNELLATLLAGYADEPVAPRPKWGDDRPTALELDLAPIRVGGRGVADVLPTEVTRSRRAWRR
jgi:hypothetical protein